MLAVGCSDKCYIRRGCPQNPNFSHLNTCKNRIIEAEYTVVDKERSK
jgi:hypothetical protein